MKRPLPTPEETARILAAKRTRPPRRPPAPAGRKLSPLLKDLNEKFGQGPAGLSARWREIAGETLSARSEPIKLTKGRGNAGAVLELRVDGSAALLIQHQAQEILARVNLALGAGAVEKLRIVQGPVKAKVAARPARHRPPPLDAAREAALTQSLAAAPEPLREALAKLGRGVLRGETRR